MMVKSIGFVINPIAGMGGRVGLKGTDGVVAQARRLGAKPLAQKRAAEMLAELARRLSARTQAPQLRWLTCAGAMGEAQLLAAGFLSRDIVVTHHPSDEPSAADTRSAVASFLARGVDLVLFCGGDGTARDICEVVGTGVVILGIPSGVKMYSGVFGSNPARTAEILLAFLDERLTTAQVDVLDLDESQYRADTWKVRLYHSALTPFEPTYSQSAKALIEAAGDDEVKAAIGHPLGIHCHNDSENAVANSLEAVRKGAHQVQGTINGYGERCGNANLCSVIAGLELKMDLRCLPEGGLATLFDVAHFVAEVANLAPDEHAAYVGNSAFAHKGGIHVAAMRRTEEP